VATAQSAAPPVGQRPPVVVVQPAGRFPRRLAELFFVREARGPGGQRHANRLAEWGPGGRSAEMVGLAVVLVGLPSRSRRGGAARLGWSHSSSATPPTVPRNAEELSPAADRRHSAITYQSPASEYVASLLPAGRTRGQGVQTPCTGQYIAGRPQVTRNAGRQAVVPWAGDTRAEGPGQRAGRGRLGGSLRSTVGGPSTRVAGC